MEIREVQLITNSFWIKENNGLLSLEISLAVMGATSDSSPLFSVRL
jgi:hypothetical protein